MDLPSFDLGTSSMLRKRATKYTKDPHTLLFGVPLIFDQKTFPLEKIQNKKNSPSVGFEPTTFRLTAERSAAELTRICFIDFSYLYISNSN